MKNSVARYAAAKCAQENARKKMRKICIQSKTCYTVIQGNCGLGKCRQMAEDSKRSHGEWLEEQSNLYSYINLNR